MKKTILSVLTVGLTMAASAYPGISNSPDVQLNQWTYQYNAARAKAAAEGRPIMLAFVNQGNCSYCGKWDANVVSNPDGQWNGFLAANPMVLIWVDAGQQGYYPGPTWSTLVFASGIWRNITLYPEIVILNSQGMLVDQFVARSSLGMNPGFINRVSAAIGGLPSNPVVPTDPVTPTDPVNPAGTFPATAVGKYTGFLLDSNNRATVRGTLEMTATKSGLVTVNIKQGRSTYTRKATGVKSEATDGSFSMTVNGSSGGALVMTVDPQGKIAGEFNGTLLGGRRVTQSGLSKFEGYYTAALDAKTVKQMQEPINNQPDGDGYLTFTVNSRGEVKYSGLLADGTKVSGASSLLMYDGSELSSVGYQGGVSGSPYACFTIYSSLYSQRGQLSGLVWIDSGSSATSPTDNLVLIGGSEWFYPGKKATLTGDSFLVDFDGYSVTQIGAYYLRSQNLAAVFAGMNMTAGGEPVAAVVASGNSIRADAGSGVSLQVSPYTGLISGKLPATGARQISASYYGVLVPAMRLGAGYYQVADPSAGVYSLKRSYPVRIADTVQ